MKKYALLLGAGLLLLLNSCNKEDLVPAIIEQPNLDRLFHETVNDSTNIDDWKKHKYSEGEESLGEPTNGS